MATERQSLADLIEVFDKHQGVFRKYVIPLFRDKENGQPETYGTALVAGSDGDVFLISAAHVFDCLQDDSTYFYADKQTKRWVSGEAKLTKIPEGKTRRDDPLDIGVLKLSGDALPPFPAANCFPVPIASLVPDALPRERRLYAATGYPTSKTKRNTQIKEVVTKCYLNLAPSVPPDRYSKLGLDPSAHIALAFNKKSTIGKSGRIQQFPDPHGMSGSPVWVQCGRKEDGAVFGVAGILTDYRRNDRVLIATDISVAMRLIREFYE